jgi:putative heme-binding domain-containing protein
LPFPSEFVELTLKIVILRTSAEVFMGIRVPVVALALSALLTSAADAQLGARQPVSVTPLVRNQAAVKAGEARFKQLCSSCHGARGEGGQGEGQGPNLANSWEVRRASDTQLSGYIRNGIPGSSLPPFGVPEQQIMELAAFVRSLNAPASSVPVPGDPVAGEAIFKGKGGCTDCHMLQGRGGYLGSDLSNVGATQRVDELRQAILNPGRLSSEGYRPVVLESAGGKSIRGVAKHYSNWSIQVLDENGQLHLLRGPEMKKVSLVDKPWMPADYSQRLSAGELEDLLAFLSRQSVRPPGTETAPSRANSRPEQENVK